MHDIKYIKNNIKAFDDAICKRGGVPCAKTFRKHDKYLSFLKKTRITRKRNLITKSFKNSTRYRKIKKQVQEIKKKLMRCLFLQKKY